MKRATGVTVLLLAATGGCMAPDTDTGPAQYMAHVWTPPPNNGPHCGVQPAPATVPGVYGPRGTPVTMIGPYNMDPPSSESAAHDMLNKSVPLDMVRRGGLPPGMPGGIIQTAGTCPPGGCPPGMPGMPGIPGIPPPGMPGIPGMPAVPGAVGPAAPGVGLAPPTIGPYGVLSGPPGSVAAVGALTNPVSPYPIQRTEVRFAGPSGMRIAWYSPQPGGKAGFGPQYLEAPARYNFLQASIYRLKLSDIPNRPGLELYPTLEVVPAKARTCAFLAHSAVPVTFTDADFDQVAAGNYVVKVIYLPDPQFQDLAATGIDELVSTQLEPGVDPIAVAQARGSILLVIRMGNIDLEAPNTPAMDAPNPFCKPPAPQGPPMPPAGPGPAGMGGRPMVPYTPVSRPGMPPGMPGMPPGMPMMGPGQMMMPPTGMPPGMPSDGLPPRQLPGAPLGQLPSPDQLQQTRYKAPSGPRPTLAELASQPAGGTTSGSK